MERNRLAYRQIEGESFRETQFIAYLEKQLVLSTRVAAEQRMWKENQTGKNKRRIERWKNRIKLRCILILQIFNIETFCLTTENIKKIKAQYLNPLSILSLISTVVQFTDPCPSTLPDSPVKPWPNFP